jgi:Domain of unknown function (DUF6538)
MTDYLQCVRGQWRVRVKVPSPLDLIIGKANLTKALGTADRAQAEALAAPHILKFKRLVATALVKQLRGLPVNPLNQRSVLDQVSTNPELAKRIVDYLQPRGRIIDPCRGSGAFFQHLPHGSEWCEAADGRDFLSFPGPVDWCITNPPWSAKHYRPIARHAFEISTNVVFLARLYNALGTTARQKDYLERGHSLKEVIGVRWADAGFEPEGFALAVFHWRRGWAGGTKWTYWI